MSLLLGAACLWNTARGDGEMAEGFAEGAGRQFRDLMQPYRVVALGEETAWRYGQVSRLLMTISLLMVRSFDVNGSPIGTTSASASPTFFVG